jgi:hypothetical protein
LLDGIEAGSTNFHEVVVVGPIATGRAGSPTIDRRRKTVNYFDGINTCVTAAVHELVVAVAARLFLEELSVPTAGSVVPLRSAMTESSVGVWGHGLKSDPVDGRSVRFSRDGSGTGERGAVISVGQQ